ncbi:MAG: lipoate--protein ligase B, partial [Herbiconiux sp.]|nr:lipoate--protein ligase B [Herbiconiux sp.]
MTDFVVEGVGRRLVPYAEGLALQAALHEKVLMGAAPDTVVLLEHESVYTAGRRTEPAERPVDGTPVVDVDRGGKITWHGPGQLVGYLVAGTTDVISVVRGLERAMVAVAREDG